MRAIFVIILITATALGLGACTGQSAPHHAAKPSAAQLERAWVRGPGGRAFKLLTSNLDKYGNRIVAGVEYQGSSMQADENNDIKLAGYGAILETDAQAAEKLPPPVSAGAYKDAMHDYVEAFSNVTNAVGNPAAIGQMSSDLNQATTELNIVHAHIPG